jgi:hypothetical protein
MMSKCSGVWKIIEAAQGDVAKIIREMLNEPQLDENMFDEAQRNRRIESMKAVDSSLSDEERHEIWCRSHYEMGWVYSAVFDPKEKTHPMLRKWGRLSIEAQSKARIFAIFAKAAQEIEALCGGNCGKCDVPASQPASLSDMVMQTNDSVLPTNDDLVSATGANALPETSATTAEDKPTESEGKSQKQKRRRRQAAEPQPEKQEEKAGE